MKELRWIKAWQTQINELQKQNLWMYYDYTPEWMSELAQAKYAATNVTLDQADNGTDTQKTDGIRVLTDYYAKYWRYYPKKWAQVIMMLWLAKQKGISISSFRRKFLKIFKTKALIWELSTIANKNPEIVKDLR